MKTVSPGRTPKLHMIRAWAARGVAEGDERVGSDARLRPEAAVERRALPRVADLRLQLGQDDAGALVGRHRLLVGPVRRVGCRDAHARLGWPGAAHAPLPRPPPAPQPVNPVVPAARGA